MAKKVEPMAGQMTRVEIARAITEATAGFIAAGMSPEAAIERAGYELRQRRNAQLEKEITAVKRFLGVEE